MSTGFEELHEGGVSVELDANIGKVADVLAGKQAETMKRRRVKDNMISIRKVVEDGKHTTAFYPASGDDLLRPVVAYDLDHEVAADTDERWADTLKSQLDELGIAFEEDVDQDNERHEITFQFGGKERKVTILLKDARVVRLQDEGYGQVDVLHIYHPTGADIPLREDEVYLKEKGVENVYEDRQAHAGIMALPEAPEVDQTIGDYKIVAEGISRDLTPDNYRLVSEGGFFISNENRLAPNSPDSLIAVVGLEERKVVRRDPSTVATAGAKEDETGYIYKKVRGLDPGIMEIFNQAIDDSDYVSFLRGLEKGDLYYIGIENSINVEEEINRRFHLLQDDTSQRFWLRNIKER